LVVGNIPAHTGIREDGKFDGLDGDANSRALVPYDARPDPVVSQQSIVATVGQSDLSIPVPQELHSRERSSARTDSATSTEALVE